MTKYLKITNQKELDTRLISLMGGTTKASDNTKIGQWGSGLKYAIAFFIRNNIEFFLYSGKNRISFSTKEEVIGSNTFNVICVNGKKTSLTTQMGGDAWSHWQCIREIWSNAVDEGGYSKEIVSQINSVSGETSFYIECTPEILTVWNDWQKYFIQDKEPMYSKENLKLYPSTGNLKIYKQGVLIGESKEDSVFMYDIKDAYINELREYKGSFANDLSNVIYSIDDPKIIDYFLSTVTEDHYEGRINYKYWKNNVWDKPNKAWLDAIGNAKIIHKEAKDKIEAKQANVDLNHTITVPKALFEGLNIHFNNISALRIASKINEFYEIYDQELELKLKQCLAILENAGYWMHPELKYVFGEFGSGTINASVDLDKKEVLLSQKMKDNSLFDFCTTLVEENEHLRTGMSDETREFQQHFINLYVKSILDKAEIKL